MVPPEAQNSAIPIQSVLKPEESLWRTAYTKAIFLSFCWGSYLISLLLGAFIYFLILPRISAISWVNYATLAILLLFYFILGSGLLLISLTAITGMDLLYPHNKKSITVKVLFPIAATLSQLVGVNRDKLRVSFVKVNNSMTIAQRKRIRGDRILILLPHCLQIDICNRKITNNIQNCQKCGKCTVGQLLELGEKYSMNLQVVNGGTLARRRVASFNPSGIVAVACERDLTLGIQDVFPIPVYGVINDRPNGPCVNTCVDMSIVEDAIKFFKENRETNIAA